MRAIILLLSLSLSGYCAFSQAAMEVMYLDNAFQETKKSKAAFVKEITPAEDNSFSVNVYSLDKTLKMTGSYVMQEDQLLEHGRFTYYHFNGQVESEGEYIYGYKTGEWKRYSQQGNPLVSRFYSADMGARIRLHVLSKIDN